MLIQIVLFGGGVIFGTRSTRYLQNRQLIHDSLNKTHASKPKLKSSGLYKKTKTSLRAAKEIIKISMSGGKLRDQQIKQISIMGDNQLDSSEACLSKI